MGDITFHVVAASADRIHAIARLTGCDTAQEVISDALRTYESIALHLAKGVKFQAIMPNGEVVGVDFLIEQQGPQLTVIEGGRNG